MSKARKAVSVSEAVQQLQALVVEEGSVLRVHTSFRAVRPIEEGTYGLIVALRRILGLNEHWSCPRGRGTMRART